MGSRLSEAAYIWQIVPTEVELIHVFAVNGRKARPITADAIIPGQMPTFD